jgi:hypothetical protein
MKSVFLYMFGLVGVLKGDEDGSGELPRLLFAITEDPLLSSRCTVKLAKKGHEFGLLRILKFKRFDIY